MAIKWKTPSGLLATVVEETEVPTNIQILLSTPDNNINVKILSGELPKGVELFVKENGYSYGFSGATQQVSEDTIYGFTLRAYNNEEFADRYFEIKVTNKKPYFKGIEDTLEVIETQYFSYQFEIENRDDNDFIVKLSGNIPSGLALNDKGLLYGLIESVDETMYYTFSIGIKRNEEIVDIKDISMVVSKIPEESAPIWVTEKGNIGQLDYKKSSNLFVKAYDPNDYSGETLRYNVIEGVLPNGLTLEQRTGRISGKLGIDETAEYYFTVRVNNEYASVDRTFMIETNVIQESEEISWNISSNLGTVKVGEQCYIQILTNSQYNVVYTKSAGDLPKGLSFVNGVIQGEVEYQKYKQYSFIVEATNGYKTISQTFTINVEKGLGYNALQCYLYINHEHDDEYTDLLSVFDKSSAYESDNTLYSISNTPLINICRLKCFDKLLLKELLYYNKPLSITFDKTYKTDYVINDETVYQVFYKGIIESNSSDFNVKYDYKNGSTETVAYPSITGIRNLLSKKIYVKQLNTNNVLYDLNTQEIVDASGAKYQNYMIYYDSLTQSYYAKNQEEVKYLDVYTVINENDSAKRVYSTIMRENYLGGDSDELNGGEAETIDFEDLVNGGSAYSTDWEEIVDNDYGRYIIKPVQVYEENLNTDVDYINYFVYEKGTKTLQENILFTLSWDTKSKFIIMNGTVKHIETINNPWVYEPSVNENPIYSKEIVLPYVSDEDVENMGTTPYVQFFDINNEDINEWKIRNIGEWKSNTLYVEGDIFTYDGTIYIVNQEFTSSGIFKTDNLRIMSNKEISEYMQPYYFPTMDLLYAKPNTNLFTYKTLNEDESKGKYFTGRKMIFYEIHFAEIYNKDIDNFTINIYNHNQENSPEFQLI